MKCEVIIEKSLKGYTNYWLITPKGTKVLMNLVMKDAKKRAKLDYKLCCEYIEDQKSQKEVAKQSKVTKKEGK